MEHTNRRKKKHNTTVKTICTRNTGEKELKLDYKAKQRINLIKSYKT